MDDRPEAPAAAHQAELIERGPVPAPKELPSVHAVRDGAALRLHVAPGARRPRIVGVHGDALKVAVAAPPEKGRANREVERVLAEAVGAAPADVTITRGRTSRRKTVAFRDWTTTALEAALRSLLT